MSKLSKIIATGLIAAGAFAASAAQAGAVFTVDPNSNNLISGTNGPIPTFQADQLVGVSSARIVQTAGTFNYTGIGYISYSAFQRNSDNVNAGVSFLNFSLPSSNLYGYGLYVTFTQTFSCSSALAVGVTCDVTSIKLGLYADALKDGANTFNKATLTTDATVTTVGNQVLLGEVTAGVGTAGLNSLGGAFQNINTNLILTAEGKNFFIEPKPFFTMTFNAFNNTTTGLSPTNGVLAINDESGTTTFGNVPEPGSLALFGLALAGVAAAGRRKAK